MVKQWFTDGQYRPTRAMDTACSGVKGSAHGAGWGAASRVWGPHVGGLDGPGLRELRPDDLHRDRAATQDLARSYWGHIDAWTRGTGMPAAVVPGDRAPHRPARALAAPADGITRAVGAVAAVIGAIQLLPS